MNRQLNFYREDPQPPFEISLIPVEGAEKQTYGFWSAEKMAEFYENITAQRQNKKGNKKHRKKKSK